MPLFRIEPTKISPAGKTCTYFAQIYSLLPNYSATAGFLYQLDLLAVLLLWQFAHTTSHLLISSIISFRELRRLTI